MDERGRLANHGLERLLLVFQLLPECWTKGSQAGSLLLHVLGHGGPRVPNHLISAKMLGKLEIGFCSVPLELCQRSKEAHTPSVLSYCLTRIWRSELRILHNKAGGLLIANADSLATLCGGVKRIFCLTDADAKLNLITHFLLQCRESPLVSRQRRD